MMPRFSGDEQSRLIVRGTVRTADSAPLAGLKVWAYDPAEPSAGELGGADLRVRAFDGSGTELAASPILFNAPDATVAGLKKCQRLKATGEQDLGWVAAALV